MPRLLTTPEVADALSVSTRTVQRLASEGRLERVSLGYRTTRFTARSVAALVDPTTSETRTTNAGLAKGDGRAGDPSPTAP